MSFRIVIPLKRNSDFKIKLLSELSNIGYTWSQGDPLSKEPSTFSRAKYLAINIIQNTCSYSSKSTALDKWKTGLGYNYIIDFENVNYILECIKYFQNYVAQDSLSYTEMDTFVNSHFSLKKEIKLL